MPTGMIILLAISILVFLGLAERVLDRLGLTDRAALIFIGAMLVGGFLPEIPLSRTLSVNIGGGIVPLILVVYLFVRAGTTMERIRAAIALLVTAVVVYIVLKIIPLEPTYAFPVIRFLFHFFNVKYILEVFTLLPLICSLAWAWSIWLSTDSNSLAISSCLAPFRKRWCKISESMVILY